MLYALVICPTTTHPFRDGEPFLILIETPPTPGCSLRFFHTLQRNFLLILSLPVSPSVATIYLLGSRSFSRYHLVYQTSPCHIRLFSSSLSSNTCRSSLRTSHSQTVRVLLYCFAARAHLRIFFLSLSTTGIPLSSFWQVQVPHKKSQFKRFRVVHWPVQIRAHSNFFS